MANICFENEVKRILTIGKKRFPGDPVMTTVLMLAKDNGSMHRLEYLEDAVQQLVYLSKNLSITVDAHTVDYRRFCGHYCDSNLPLQYFYVS